MAHFLGNKGKSSTSAGKDPTPDPSPNSKREFGEGRRGASIAVLQFVALVRGEWGVQALRSPFRVEMVTAEERYCLGCCGVRWFDVVVGFQVPSVRCQVAYCRCCGKEFGK